MEGGRLIHAEAHRHRFACSAPWLAEAFRSLEAHFASAPDGMVRMRLDEDGGRLWASWEPLPPTPSPYRLLALPHPLPRAAAPRLKGADGAWHSPLLEAARSAGAEDALLHWPDGTVAETAIAAVVLERQGRLWIPPEGGRVASLAEAVDLPRWIQERGWVAEARAFNVEEARRGQLWCLNAVRGMWQAECLPPPLPMNG